MISDDYLDDFGQFWTILDSFGWFQTILYERKKDVKEKDAKDAIEKKDAKGKKTQKKKDAKVKKEDKGSSFTTKESRGQAKPLTGLKRMIFWLSCLLNSSSIQLGN